MTIAKKTSLPLYLSHRAERIEMSAMQDIFDSLSKHAGDKKTQLDARYTVHSKWLKDEFDIVRSLIERNPRESTSILSESTQLNVFDAAIKTTAQTVSPPAVEKDSSKRKYEASVSSLLSPEQKRTSTDYEELQQQAGMLTTLHSY